MSKRAHLHAEHPGETLKSTLAKSRKVDKDFMRKITEKERKRKMEEGQ